ncbi:hypothetical protein [Treponema vincentii]|uniref:hypothetical protein n=1 Tax=Treponema vincentii TaxID=69710 RepID=UPI0020A5D6BB|nr:hypothetical protein [Treponema vincentii]UTC47440.1 hypothetical protein E4N73_00590 [Treponema vincentii]UTC48350.1 hypothetical protein E4N73_05655 [Treponema vincentii]
MEKVEKILEQLEAEYKKAVENLEALAQKRNDAEKKLESNPDDEKLKKKLEGIKKAVQTAQDKLFATAKAVEDVKKAGQEKDTGGETPAEPSGEKTPKNQGDDNPDNNAGAENSGSNSGDSGTKKIRIRCRSKTGKPSYFRAGLRFTPVDAEYEVTEAVAEILKNDPWLDGKTIE